ncbi:EAL domain-containing protein [uncultured Shewanella sp.]|uniref:bifunctional diguanylate cyclase/phosphodiesterase n=1 Tax=Shewanella atlantica TaxID=271099 RepID=UPI0026250B59|nr:EAL domain-containing protein [uncultured Shewanella sp.]
MMDKAAERHLHDEHLLNEISVTAAEIAVPEDMFNSWQQTLDLISEIVDTPAVLIMRIHKDDNKMEVFASSRSIGNPYRRHDKDSLGHGLYCETVIAQNSELHIPNALKDRDWDNNPDLKLGMIAYCGLPLLWPDNTPFGTICMLDNKEHSYNNKFRHLLARFQEAIITNLASLYQQEKLRFLNRILEKRVQLRTHELAELSTKLIREIEDRTSAEYTLEYSKTYDELTGLPKRTSLVESLNQMLKRVKGSQVVTVLYFGLRKFKSINDTYGYVVGDQILSQFSQRITRQLNEDAVIARIAGSEFVIAHSHKRSSRDELSLITNILNCCNSPFYIADFTITVPSCMGIAQFPADAKTTEELLQKSSAAMSISKTEGASYSFFNRDTHSKIRQRYQLESHLVDALSNQELYLNYQPLICLKTKEIIGAEALLRWHNPVLGQVPPDQFINLAEHNGQIIEIGNFVLHSALSQAAQWLLLRQNEFRIAINISPLQFRAPNFAEHIADLLTLYQLPATSLELEITEGILLQDEHLAHDSIQKLQALGIRISLDDFGTGYSSLSYLQKYSFNTLKIDRCFITNLHKKEQDRELTRAIIAMGKKLNLHVIAEGVETHEQDDFIQSEGCDYGQGYLYGKPSSAEDFEADYLAD